MTQEIILNNKPLVEAIFEYRWKLKENNGLVYDPPYKIFLGQFFGKVKNEYSEHRQLPQANMPEEFSPYVVHHQFRKKETGWPLIQIGPGILTLNETESYTWKDFCHRTNGALDSLFAVYPKAESDLRTQAVSLRYIDAVTFNYEKDDVFDFIEEKLKTGISIHDGLFKGTGVDKQPLAFDLRFEFPSSLPVGFAKLRFVRGKGKKGDLIIWETVVTAEGGEVPNGKDAIKSWAQQAHDLSHNWFFKMIDGELLSKFK